MLITGLPLVLLACRGREGAAQGAQTTQTIAPAAAKPAPEDNEALTQTVDIEDSRSEAEGGVLASPPPAKKAPAPPPVKKKK
ncbi:MAG: hypothetical protein AABO58_12240 [Acidobacteriota bacterium]